MKTRILVAGLCILAGAVALAGNVTLSVEAKNTKREQTTWKTAWGSYGKESQQQKTVHVRLKSSDAGTQTYTVEWFFVAEGQDGKERWIFDRGHREVRLGAGQEAEFDAESAVLQATDQKLKVLNARTRTGGKYDGYLVIVSDGGAVVAKVSSKPSSPEYERKVMGLIEQPPAAGK